MEGKKVKHKNSPKNRKKKRLMQKRDFKSNSCEKMEIINIFGRSVESNNLFENNKKRISLFPNKFKKIKPP